VTWASPRTSWSESSREGVGDRGPQATLVESMAKGRKPPSTNLDLVRSIYADWERGDYSSAEWAHPNIELIVADGPSPGRCEGLRAMAASARDLFSVWEDLRAEAEEYRALDGERVLVLDRRTGHGKSSRLELADMTTQGGTVWQMRDGKVTRLVLYFDRDRALADLGLAPEGEA
jgi:ketosteroid isomerase-like protein